MELFERGDTDWKLIGGEEEVVEKGGKQWRRTGKGEEKRHSGGITAPLCEGAAVGGKEKYGDTAMKVEAGGEKMDGQGGVEWEKMGEGVNGKYNGGITVQWEEEVAVGGEKKYGDTAMEVETGGGELAEQGGEEGEKMGEGVIEKYYGGTTVRLDRRKSEGGGKRTGGKQEDTAGERNWRTGGEERLRSTREKEGEKGYCGGNTARWAEEAVVGREKKNGGEQEDTAGEKDSTVGEGGSIEKEEEKMYYGIDTARLDREVEGEEGVIARKEQEDTAGGEVRTKGGGGSIKVDMGKEKERERGSCAVVSGAGVTDEVIVGAKRTGAVAYGEVVPGAVTPAVGTGRKEGREGGVTVQQQEGGEVGEEGSGGVGQLSMRGRRKEGGKGGERKIREEVDLEEVERKLYKHTREVREAKVKYVQEREGMREQHQDRKRGKGEPKEIWWSDGVAEREKKNKEEKGGGMRGGRTEWCRMEGGFGNGWMIRSGPGGTEQRRQSGRRGEVEEPQKEWEKRGQRVWGKGDTSWEERKRGSGSAGHGGGWRAVIQTK
jgi:hypothetical protein